MKDLQYINRNRHPKNKFGFATPEFYQEEYRLYGVKTDEERKEFWRLRKENSPKCGICGTPTGFSFGTGDCGCIGEE